MRRSRGPLRLSVALAIAAALSCAHGSRTTVPPEAPSPAPGAPRDTSRARADSAHPAEPIDRVPAPEERRLQGGRVVRIALATHASQVTLSATGEWRLYDSGGESTLLRADGGDLWSVERRGAGLRAVHDDGSVTASRPGPFVARTVARGAFITVNGKRYRGEVWVVPSHGALTVVNRLYLEDYLRGVVPLEIGHRAPGEEAAVAAQAVAARSYAFTHLAPNARDPYDMVSTVFDQVYGGADAETPMSDAAVAATTGLVLTYAGRVVNAPYHSTCGGSTAAASEVWRTADEPYLKPVSDRIPGSDRFYCDISPKFRWTRTLTVSALRAGLDRYLSQYAVGADGPIGRPESVEIDGHTPTGRVRAVVIRTERGRFTVRGNDIRFVLRPSGGEILNSTYFSIDTERDANGALERLILRGAGYGHGIGMCQWGAIGRARAGQGFRTILRTYYPGTDIEPIDG